MAEVNVTIKTDKSVLAERFVTANIGASIDTPNNITFVDSNGDATFINRIMTEADGTIEVRPFGGADSDKYTIYLVKGGWHKTEPIGYMYGDDGNTDSSLGIRVRHADKKYS